MALTKSEKNTIIKKWQLNEKDTASPEVQIALLTEEINLLTKHLIKNKKDVHSLTGLRKKVGKRTDLLRYLKSRDEERYNKIVKELNIRK
ncbi:MAG: 30S ribosomal protein S15 [Mycoplasmataceae bacterium]|nr:30S ribosomal protein S15 [Mycoplasmataceae bacterium]